jgi:hypothetical protein
MHATELDMENTNGIPDAKRGGSRKREERK